MKVEANIILAKCKKADQLYGVRVEKRNGDWYRTWAFKIKEDDANKEGFDAVKLNGSFYETDEYPGCPYCGGSGFLVCGCGKIYCWDGQEGESTCVWCGSTGKITTADSLNISGGGY